LTWDRRDLARPRRSSRPAPRRCEGARDCQDQRPLSQWNRSPKCQRTLVWGAGQSGIAVVREVPVSYRGTQLLAERGRTLAPRHVVDARVLAQGDTVSLCPGPSSPRPDGSGSLPRPAAQPAPAGQGSGYSGRSEEAGRATEADPAACPCVPCDEFTPRRVRPPPARDRTRRTSEAL